MRILIATDAASPQINGVVTTLENTKRELALMGHEVRTIEPNDFKQLRNPFYPEVPIAIVNMKTIQRTFELFNPDAIHIATEGTIGMAVRRHCVRKKYKFTTSYHTNWATGLKHYGVPVKVSERYLRWFHSKSSRVLVSTETLQKELKEKGYGETGIWFRGVSDMFKPRVENLQDTNKHLCFGYVGRISKEKNIEAFLELPLHEYGYRMVIGDGPYLKTLQNKFPAVTYTGKLEGDRLIGAYQTMDVFVFPSKFDTLGMVMMEAIACGTPVAAYPVQGPIDVVKEGVTGYLNNDLKQAVLDCLELNRYTIASEGSKYSWRKATEQFIDNLVWRI